MKKILSVLLLVCMLAALPVTSFAKVGDINGYAKYTDISAYINHYPITSYNIYDNTAVIAEDLVNYGFTVEWNEYERALYISKNEWATDITPYGTIYKNATVAGQVSFSTLSTDIKTYVNGKKVQSFNIGGKTCIYIDALAPCGELVWTPDLRAIKLWVAGLPIAEYAPLQEYPKSAYGDGSLPDPYHAANGVTATLQRWSTDPSRQISFTCTNVIRGAAANELAHSENMFNQKPDANTEWLFMQFNINYISSSAGANDQMTASDLLFYSYYATESGAPLSVKDGATLSHAYDGCDMYDVKLLPGQSGTVLVGCLIDKSVGDVLLGVKNSATGTSTWAYCTR